MEFIEKGVPEVGPEYLKPTEFFDFDVAAVRDFATEAVRGAETTKEKAVRLYYAVRDGIRYDPYRIRLERDLFKASSVLAAGAGFCLPKANLLVACCRAVGIAAGIGLSDVLNHLCTERLAHIMGGKEKFLHHGYAVIHVDGKWVKAAPAFNIELCRKFDVLPTDMSPELCEAVGQVFGPGIDTILTNPDRANDFRARRTRLIKHVTVPRVGPATPGDAAPSRYLVSLRQEWRFLGYTLGEVADIEPLSPGSIIQTATRAIADTTERTSSSVEDVRRQATSLLESTLSRLSSI
jgi:transglutaminase-like putative cysteine protease